MLEVFLLYSVITRLLTKARYIMEAMLFHINQLTLVRFT